MDRVASPSPRQSVLVAAGGAGAANGWGDGSGAGRPPRPKASPRMSAAQLAPPAGRAGETDAAFTDGTPPGLRGGLNEVSESEAAALSGSGQRPAHLYAGPANRSNTAAAEYLRNQVGGAVPGAAAWICCCVEGGTAAAGAAAAAGAEAAAACVAQGCLLAAARMLKDALHVAVDMPRCRASRFPPCWLRGHRRVRRRC